MMYRLISSVFAIIVLINPFLSVSFAQESDMEDIFGTIFSDFDLGAIDTSFGFSESDQFTFLNKTNSSVEISIPIVKKDNSPVLSYEVWGGNTNFDNFDEWKDECSINKEITISNTDITNDRTVLKIENLICRSYVVSITPIHEGKTGRSSNEVSFSLSSSSNTTNGGNNTTFHGSSDPDMNLANVTYDHDGLSVDVSWNPLAGADQVQISSATISNSNNLTVEGTVSMNVGNFDFNVPAEGTYLIKLQPLNNGAAVGTEVMQTLHLVGAGDPDPNTPIPYVNKVDVGPEEYIPYILIGSIFAYVLIRRLKR